MVCYMHSSTKQWIANVKIYTWIVLEEVGNVHLCDVDRVTPALLNSWGVAQFTSKLELGEKTGLQHDDSNTVFCIIFLIQWDSGP